MTIAKRLIILLTVPLLALLSLGIFIRVQLAKIEARSRFLAESRIPSLTVLSDLSRTYAALRAEVQIHLLATNQLGQTKARSAFDDGEAVMTRLLRQYADNLISDDQDRRLLHDYRDGSRDWVAAARQVMSLAAADRRDEALALLNGSVAELGLRLSQISSEWIRHNKDLALVAGQTAVEAIEGSRGKMFVAVCAVIALSGVLGFLAFRRIVPPIRALKTSVTAIAAGDYATKVPFTQAADETGELARSIDVLKQGAMAMKEQRWVKSNAAKLTEKLQEATSFAEFGQRLASGLLPMLGGGVAGLYLFESHTERFRRIAAYGLEQSADSADSFRLGEGLIGQCAQQRAPVVLSNLPAHYLRIASGLGGATPVQAVALPLLSKENLLGILELATFRAFTSQEQALIDQVLPTAAMNLEILQHHLRTRELLDQSQDQARRLQEQTEELTQSQAELLAQKEELLSQQRELTAQREQLQLAEERTRLILESTGDGLFGVDTEGRIDFVNRAACRMLGFNAEELIGQASHSLIHHHRPDGSIYPLEECPMMAAYRHGRISRIDHEFLWRKDGQSLPVEYGATPIVKDGAVVGAVISFTDITLRKQQEREILTAKVKAEEATQLKSMFLANMSHEIRTPMNAILGLTHLALKMPLSPKQRDYLTKVQDAGKSLLSIINDILDFSKIEAGRLDLEKIDFPIDDVIASVITLTAQKAHDKGIEFLADVAPALPGSLRGDPLRLGQILTNLVNNAVKFTEQGEIRLKVEPLQRAGERIQLKFSVRDTGIGMTREQAARLFQPFTQADMSTTRKHGGTGLGLTICRRLVELMDGEIWLESEPGVGSTFTFTVWLGIGQAISSEKVSSAEFQHLRVLVVDDNAAAREILVESLKALTEHVDAVSSGEEAIAAIKEHDAEAPYDVVFMDWCMPGMDGLQATWSIKSDGLLRKPPAVIVVTAFGREEAREEADKLRVDGFLVKPVTKSMLVCSLANLFLESAKSGTVATGTAEERPRLQGLRVLLTEDNEINQQIARELLESVGAQLDLAHNGREAVDKLLRGPFPPPYDVVLMDLQMPEMDGYEATAKIRLDSRFASLPIIAMTAHATTEERQRCLGVGMNDHLAKPIEPARLYATLERYRKPPEPSLSASAGNAPVASPGSEARPSAGDLPSVEGLDTRDGLSRVAGNSALYLKLLRQFVEQQGPAAAQVADALARGDSRLAERLTHTVKGVAGNLGAPAVQQAAAALERAITTKVPAPELAPILRELQNTLEGFVGRLRAALPPTEAVTTAVTPPVPLDPEQARKVVQEMVGHLNHFDPAAGEVLQEHREVFRALLPEEAFHSFQQHVEGYAFANALNTLRQAAAEKGVLSW